MELILMNDADLLILKLNVAVKKNKAHLGIALDGDADRLILCDEKGTIIDGDQIIGMIETKIAL